MRCCHHAAAAVLAPIAVLIWCGPSEAEPAKTDTVAADSLALPSPRGAFLRSAVVPGWGQYYNGKPFRAVAFCGGVASLVAWAVSAQQELGRLDDELTNLRQTSPGSWYQIELLEQAHQDQAARRNTRVLYVALGVTFTALEAYVDAHLASLDEEPKLSLIPIPGGGLVRLCASW